MDNEGNVILTGGLVLQDATIWAEFIENLVIPHNNASELYFEENNIDYEDYGTYSEERTDYPIYAKKVAEAMVTGNADKGILICRSGYGMTVVANKFKGVRAASVTSVAYAKSAKADDDINLLTLSGDNTTIKEAIEMINAWLETEFKGGRYKERLDMLEKIENENMK